MIQKTKSGAITARSHQIATRILHEVHALMERDAGPNRGVSTVNNAILEKYYAPELKKIRAAASKTKK